MKKAMLHGLVGFPIGVAIGYTFTIIISLIFADGNYSPVVPSMIDICGNEINAVLLQFILCGIIGFAYSAVSVIWENEKLSLLAQSAIHFAVASVSMLPIAYVCQWMEHSIVGFFEYAAIFAAIYLIIWLSTYLTIRKKIKEINTKIAGK